MASVARVWGSEKGEVHIFAALRSAIGLEAMRFQFLEESPRLSEYEKEMYQAIIQAENGAFTMVDPALLTSLNVLSQILEKHYEKKVIILIDDQLS